MTSSKVAKIVSYRQKATTPCMVSLWSAPQDTSNVIYFHLKVTFMSRDLRLTGNLDLMSSNHCMCIPMRINERIPMVLLFFL